MSSGLFLFIGQIDNDMKSQKNYFTKPNPPIKIMSNLSFKFNEAEKIIEIDQPVIAYEEDDVEVYIRFVLNPPAGYLVRGDAVNNGMNIITYFRGIDEFTRAFAILHADERQIDYRFARACELCNLPVAQFLRGLGANVNGNGEVPLDRMYASFEQAWPEERKQRYFDVMRYLLSFEDLDIHLNSWLRPALGRAIEHGYPVDVIEGLLRRGANPNGGILGGDPYIFDKPLCDAARQDNFPLVELLLRYGADPLLRNVADDLLPRDCTQDPAIRVLLDSYTETFQILYCLQQSGASIDVDATLDLISYDSAFATATVAAAAAAAANADSDDE